METRTFQVPNIGCDGCVRTIRSEIGQLPGVEQVEADKDTRIVTVNWQAPASWALIKDKLVEIDYAPAEG